MGDIYETICSPASSAEEKLAALQRARKDVLRNGDKVENAIDLFFPPQQQPPNGANRFCQALKAILVSNSTLLSHLAAAPGSTVEEKQRNTPLVSASWAFLVDVSRPGCPIEVRKQVLQDLGEVVVKSLMIEEDIKPVLAILMNLSVHADAAVVLMLLGVITRLLDLLHRAPVDIARDLLAVLSNLAMSPQVRPLLVQQLLENPALTKAVIGHIKAESLSHAFFAAMVVTLLMLQNRDYFVGLRALERLEDFADRNPSEAVKGGPSPTKDMAGEIAKLTSSFTVAADSAPSQQPSASPPPFFFVWFCARFTNTDVQIAGEHSQSITEVLRGGCAPLLRSLALVHPHARVRMLAATALRNMDDREFHKMATMEGLVISAGCCLGDGGAAAGSLAKHLAKEDIDLSLLLSMSMTHAEVSELLDRAARAGVDKNLSRIGTMAKLVSYIRLKRIELHSPWMSSPTAAAASHPPPVHGAPPVAVAASRSHADDDGSYDRGNRQNSTRVVEEETTTAVAAKPKSLSRIESRKELLEAQKQCFISYSWFNKASAKRVRAMLESFGFTCWMDETVMQGGDSLFGAIDAGISNCNVVIACISNKYGESVNCRREMLLSIERGKLVIPILVSEVSPWPPRGDLGPVLAGKLYIDLSSEDKLMERGPQLVDALKQVIDE